MAGQGRATAGSGCRSPSGRQISCEQHRHRWLRDFSQVHNNNNVHQAWLLGAVISVVQVSILAQVEIAFLHSLSCSSLRLQTIRQRMHQHTHTQNESSVPKASDAGQKRPGGPPQTSSCRYISNTCSCGRLRHIRLLQLTHNATRQQYEWDGCKET